MFLFYLFIYSFIFCTWDEGSVSEGGKEGRKGGRKAGREGRKEGGKEGRVVSCRPENK